MCSHGPQRNEKLKPTLTHNIKHVWCKCVVQTYLPKLQRLPRVKRAANFRDLTRIIGDRANA